MVTKQAMEDVSHPPNNDPTKALAVLGAIAAALPVGYAVSRGGLGISEAASSAFNKLRKPGSLLGPKKPSLGSFLEDEGPSMEHEFNLGRFAMRD